MSDPGFGVARQPLHVRTINLEGFEREDGLFEIEARLTDVKARDYLIATGLRRAGAPIHDMWVKVAVTAAFEIVAVDVRAEAVPYVGGL